MSVSRSDYQVPLIKEGCGMLATRAGSLAAVAVAALLASAPAFGQQATSLNGPPVQVQPTAMEPGVPLITISPGTPNPFPSPDPAPGAGGGGDQGAGDGGGGGGGAGGGPALDTMLARGWGAAAVANAQALGVNASALAGTCVMESGCQNIPNAGGGVATGPFQMLPSTFTAMYAAALRDNPSLAANTTGNVNDPASQSAAAAEYLKQTAQMLQRGGISNPTLLDVRAGYGFGNGYAVAVATAPNDTPLGTILTAWSPRTWQQNGLTPTTTVGQWRANILAKAGAAANAPVLSR